MSFFVSVPATKKGEFADAANGLAIPETIRSPGGTDMFNEARRAAIDLAATLSGPSEYISCSISGHTYVEGFGLHSNGYPKNSLNVSITETDA